MTLVHGVVEKVSRSIDLVSHKHARIIQCKRDVGRRTEQCVGRLKVYTIDAADKLLPDKQIQGRLAAYEKNCKAMQEQISESARTWSSGACESISKVLDPAPSLLAGRFLRLVVDKELRGEVGDFGCPTAFEPLGALAAGLLPPLREDI